MKSKIASLSERYVAALRKHLTGNPPPSLQAAAQIGNEALALGLETLELARIHACALAVLSPLARKKSLARRAEIFFTKAADPIVATHSGAPLDKITLNRLAGMTGQSAAKLATTRRHLVRSIARRKLRADAFKANRKHQQRCLEKSVKQQKQLRKASHQALAALEAGRKKMSHKLQDEIAQTLLGIRLRLLSLRHQAQSDPDNLKNEIASTQRLVVKSAASLRRFAHKLDNHHVERGHRPPPTVR